MSPDPPPVPASCRAAYHRCAADLGRSAVVARTRTHHARAVRRFLRGRQWAALNDCAASLHLPRVTMAPRLSRRPTRAGASP